MTGRRGGDDSGGAYGGPLYGSTAEVTLEAARRLRDIPRPEAHASGLPLPSLEAPSLEGLSVTVPAPQGVSREQLLERFHALVREHASGRDRPRGEPLRMGDQVWVDVLGYSGGHLIPFSARSGLSLELAPHAVLPGFSEALVGHAVGDTVQARLTLPEDYPVASLRGRPAVFLVDLLAARALTLPDADSEAFLATLGRGPTHEAVMASLLTELEGERAEALRAEARERVLGALVERAGSPEVPAALVDEEVRRQWLHTEAPLLRDKGFDASELQEALEGWLRDGPTRERAERRLRVGRVLGAVARREGVLLANERLDAVLDDVAAQLELSADELREGGDPVYDRMQEVAWHLVVMDHVLSRTHVHFEGA